MKTIGMVAAMTAELDALLEKLNARSVAEYNGNSVKLARAKGKKIYMIESGIGEIAAAAACQHLISAFKAQAIINFGVCGSLNPARPLKSTALVSGVVHYEFDTSAVDGMEIGRYPFSDGPVIATDSLFDKIDVEGIDKVICASGNKFIADEGEKRRLADLFGAEICEMEAAGVALTCRANSVPCLIVKAVSDAEGGAGDYAENLHSAARAYIELILSLLEKL